MNQPPTAPKPHHHGNLRSALINAGIELLERDGPDGLTLRKCAQLAGVSHAAPAHHFNGLISLKIAIIARSHEIFARTMRQHRDRADPSAQAGLEAICLGYVAFARAHTGLFHFMFHPHGEIPDDTDATTLGELEAASNASYEVLHRACLPFAGSDAECLRIETMIWSLVHGYAMLFTGTDAAQTPGGAVPEFSAILPKLTPVR